MRYHFHTEQWVASAVEPLFAFFANPNNLPRLAPPQQKLRLEAASFAAPPWYPTPPRTLIAGEGSKVTLSFRPLPGFFLRFFWDLEITSFIWNESFTDLQTRGPFAAWRHTHSFARETREVEGTLLSDDIEYEMAGGVPGTWLQPLVQRQLQAMFRYRHEQLEKMSKKTPRDV